jgi:hypothetical protein
MQHIEAVAEQVTAKDVAERHATPVSMLANKNEWL